METGILVLDEATLKPGRLSAEQVTVCDLTGTGVQDTAIAIHALHAAGWHPDSG